MAPFLWIILLPAVLTLVRVRCGTTLEPDTVSEYEKGLQMTLNDYLQEINDTTSLNANIKSIKSNSHFPNGSLFTKFPCQKLSPSKSKPNSVHELRPADIDVAAAIGDSLTAGKAAGYHGAAAVLFDYRGLAWSIGGDGTFSTLHSLPNILREYNPNLYGFSNSIGNLMSVASRLNVAKSGATSSDLAFQAALLIQRLKNDPNVDFEKDWKVITILIGANDLCRSCKAMFSPSLYVHHIQSALDILHDTVPRVFVNLVEIMPVELVRYLPRGTFCKRIQTFYCQCAVSPKSERHYKELIHDRMEFQRLTEQLISSGRYDDKQDFTVVMQPFYRNATLQTIPGTNDIDYSLYAVDCFHHSAKGHSHAGLGLWNNMLQPIKQKSTDWYVTESMLCPTEAHSFLATAKNSKRLEKAKGLEQHSWLRNTIHTVSEKDSLISKTQIHRKTFSDDANLLSKTTQTELNPDILYFQSNSSTAGRLPGILNFPDPKLPVASLVITEEPAIWQIWTIVLGWTLLMSAILAFSVFIKSRFFPACPAKSTQILMEASKQPMIG